MKNNAICLTLVLGLCLVLSFSANAETGTVKGVVSGDALNIEIGGTTAIHRLYGVDAPEEGQAYSLEAKQFLGVKVLDQTVEVEVLTQDEKGTPVATISLADGQALNDLLVKTGHAWWDTQNAPNALELQSANAQAIEAKAGLWGTGAPLAPWDYRLSNDIESAAYTLEEKVEAPAPRDEPMEEEPKVLSAKGNEVYRGNFIDAGQFDPKVVDGLDPMELMGKHMPRLATDANGKAVGITADNISQLPYASQIGLQDGDIISSVNGISLTGGLPQILSLVEQNKNNPPKSISVNINRGGEIKTININLP